MGDERHLKKESFSPSRVFYAGFPSYMKRPDLKKFFRFYGSFNELIILEKCQTVLYGYVNFESVQTAERLIEMKIIPFKDYQVEIKAAIPKKGIETLKHQKVSEHPLQADI